MSYTTFSLTPSRSTVAPLLRCLRNAWATTVVSRCSSLAHAVQVLASCADRLSGACWRLALQFLMVEAGRSPDPGLARGLGVDQAQVPQHLGGVDNWYGEGIFGVVTSRDQHGAELASLGATKLGRKPPNAKKCAVGIHLTGDGHVAG